MLKIAKAIVCKVVGLATDYCVYWTSSDAKLLGYDTTMVQDASAGIAAETIEFALSDMESDGIILTNTADLLYKLNDRSKCEL